MDKVESAIIHALTAKGFGIPTRIEAVVDEARSLPQQALESL